ncbi:hypothetical protein Pyn_41189 [Prunus yedoensis var. nudiflora]|uniref:Uncharacterized protein n=1 Tax=Prunus yedoensis var. nudiflora TaxID=2094558 RepID=A0A314YDG3_PRUYE|nr:hypothetical protein Pyn_41189 [Prunus yedoensis var. nudiflora]
MLSRSDMGVLQETLSSGSCFRGDRSDTEVVEEMYETAEQMGEDMPINLGGNFSGGGDEKGDQGDVTVVVVGSGGEGNDGDAGAD